MSASVLSPGQFKGTRQRRKDPTSDRRKNKFGGAKGPKTMKVEAGTGLPPTPTKHPHSPKAVKSTKRAK
jgi:hypothetical protein